MKEHAVAATAGAFTFEQGFPSEEAARRARDEVDFHRAIIAFRFWFPTVTVEAIFEGLNECGAREDQSVAIYQAMVVTPAMGSVREGAGNAIEALSIR